jgi:hypothetical protein
MMTEIRLRSRTAPETLDAQKGKILTHADYDLLVKGPTRVLKPDGKPLAVYLPGALAGDVLEASYDTLHSLKSMETDNRGLASGTKRVKYSETTTRSRSKNVPSTIIGAFDANPRFQYCRLTAWSGKEWDKWSNLFPLFEAIGDRFAAEVPERFAVQQRMAEQTHSDWRIGRTPFTTITVNNTYPTGVHTDAGDLQEGFSTLAVIRRGSYSGGNLVFPEYRVAVDMQHGDLLLMDAHEWHGNVALKDETPECEWCKEPATIRIAAVRPDTGKTVWRTICKRHQEQLVAQKNIAISETQPVIPMERISVVSYYRTNMKECGSAEEEAARAAINAANRTGIVDEMALEAAGTGG